MDVRVTREVIDRWRVNAIHMNKQRLKGEYKGLGKISLQDYEAYEESIARYYKSKLKEYGYE